MDFRVPELGEGIETATVVRVLVAPGAEVKAGQDLVEVETEKATVPIPAEQAGRIDRIAVKPGDKVKVGAILMTLSDGAPPATPKAPTPQSTGAKSPPAAPVSSTPPAPAPTKAASQTRIEFAIPDLGEGIESGRVVNVMVKPGDAVAADQPLIELETEKATIPIPSPVQGKIVELRIKRGQDVKVGEVIVVLDAEGGQPGRTAPKQPAPPQSEKPTPAPAPTAAKPAPASPPAQVSRNGIPVPASPATRRLARELGVDLHQITGTASGGRITQDDVKAHARQLIQGRAVSPAAAVAPSIPPLPDFGKWGPIEKKPFTALRKAIARNLSLSWSLAPQVTQHDLADITELEEQRKKAVDAAPKDAPRITMTVLAVKACVAALKAFPQFNASYDASSGENGTLILKQYYHIGIAVDTERGLVVPVIRDADKKHVSELAREVSDLAQKARAGKLMPDEMRGGTFTITNLGGIGGTLFSPIINYPEVAILGLSRSSWQPSVRDGQIVPRLLLPLSLTYDHRVIDGADGARFCARLAETFSNPVRLVFES
jgi:pyruvate dehydrogenase E2 component (dihydrolipoamide acetyltransferase)